MPVRIAHRPAQPKTDGLSAATAIDLTDDPPHPPRPPSLPVLSVEASQRTSVVKPHKKRKRDEPGFEELTSHHKLTWWKNFHFKKLDIDREYNLVAQFPLASAKITTIVPHRYLRAVGISCERKRAKRQTKIPEFPGTVRILGPVEAVREAYEEHSPNNLHDPSRLVLWTDGSGHSGLSVVYRQVLSCGRQFGPWTCYGFNVPRQKLGLGSSDMEYLGLIKALDIVLDQTRTQPNRWKEYSIYTDAKTVLDDLKGRSRGRLVQHIVNKARAITGLGAVVRLHWVPGHSRVPGNVLADRVAGRAARHVYNSDDEYIDLSSDEDGHEGYKRELLCGAGEETGKGPAESEQDIFADLEAAINNELAQSVMP